MRAHQQAATQVRHNVGIKGHSSVHKSRGGGGVDEGSKGTNDIDGHFTNEFAEHGLREAEAAGRETEKGEYCIRFKGKKYWINIKNDEGIKPEFAAPTERREGVGRREEL